MPSYRLSLSVVGVLLFVGCGVVPGQPSSPITVTVTAPPPASASSSSTASSIGQPSQEPSPTATAPSTLQQAYEKDAGGVVRFEVATCDGLATGSGFKITDSLAVTAAHVVDGASVVRVISGITSTSATVIGMDTGADVALVRLTKPLDGPNLEFSSVSPKVGDQVAAVGFPEGDPITFSPGTINGLNRKAVIDGEARHSMLELDAATTHGSSGGPVIATDASVVGLVDAGPDSEPGHRLAVSSATAVPLVSTWSANPNPRDAASCSSPVGPNGQAVVVSDPSSAEDEAVATLVVYFDSINNGDFPTALAQLYTPQNLNSFARAVTSSQDAVSYAAILGPSTDGSPVIWVKFTSHQDAGKGPDDTPDETCTNWSLDYHFARRNGLWLIRRTSAHEGSRSSPC